MLLSVKYAPVTRQGRWAVGCLFVSMERSHKARTRNLICKTSKTAMQRRKPKRTRYHLQIYSHLRCTTVSIVYIPKLLATIIYIYIISQVNSTYDIYIKIIKLGYTISMSIPTGAWHLKFPFSQVQIPDLGRDVLRTPCSSSCDAGSFTGAKQDRLVVRTTGCGFRRTGAPWDQVTSLGSNEIGLEGGPTLFYPDPEKI